MAADRVCSPTLLELFQALLPAGSTALTGLVEWKAAILCEPSTVPDEIDDPTKLVMADYTDLSEYPAIGTTYARVTLTGVTITLVGTQIRLYFTDGGGWPTLAGTQLRKPMWIAVFIIPNGLTDNDATNRLLLLIEASFTPDGQAVAIAVPADGIALFNTVPS